jgi:hypothetical protein
MRATHPVTILMLQRGQLKPRTVGIEGGWYGWINVKFREDELK